MKVRVADYIDNYFQISARSSTIPQEIRSGITTFLTLSYILLVNPQVLSKVGIPATDIGNHVPSTIPNDLFDFL